MKPYVAASNCFLSPKVTNINVTLFVPFRDGVVFASFRRVLPYAILSVSFGDKSEAFVRHFGASVRLSDRFVSNSGAFVRLLGAFVTDFSGFVSNSNCFVTYLHRFGSGSDGFVSNS